MVWRRRGLRRAASASFVLLLVLVAPVAAIAGTPAVVQLGAVSTDGQDARDPQIAIDSAGDMLAGWERFDGTNWRVQVAYKPVGRPFGAPVDLSAPGRDADGVQVAMNARGDGFVAFRRFSGARYDLAAVMRPAGGDFGPANAFQQDAAVSMNGNVAIDGTGRGYVGFHGGGGDSVAVFPPAGAVYYLGPVPILDTNSLSVDALGDVVAVGSRPYEGTRAGSEFAYAAPPGGNFGTPSRVQDTLNQATVPTHEAASVVRPSGRNIVASGQVPADDPGSGAQLVQSPGIGAFFHSSADPMSDLTTERAYAPAAAVNANGDGVLAWSGEGASAGSPVHPDIRFAFLTPEGTKFGAGSTAGALGDGIAFGSFLRPRAAESGDGTAYVSWSAGAGLKLTQHTLDGGGAQDMKLSPDGVSVPRESLLVVAGLSLVADGGRNAVAAYMGTVAGGHPRVMVSGYQASGPVVCLSL